MGVKAYRVEHFDPEGNGYVWTFEAENTHEALSRVSREAGWCEGDTLRLRTPSGEDLRLRWSEYSQCWL